MRPLDFSGLEPFEITGIGSLPHSDAEGAVSFVMKYLPRLPHWPQLPKRSKAEEMTRQFLEGIPGVREEDDRVWLQRPESAPGEWEAYWEASESEDLEAFAISEERAKGFYVFLRRLRDYNPPSVKGQLIGPLTLGFSLKDETGRYAFYDQALRDMLIRVLNLKAKWQIKRLKEAHSEVRVFLFFDEPCLGAVGTPAISLSREELLRCYGGLLEGLDAVKGIHVCANTDWTLLLEAGFDLLSFDCYNFGESLLLWKDHLRVFLRRDGYIAWGIVPTEPLLIGSFKTEGLVELLLDYVRKSGLLFDFSPFQFLITPSCGLGTLDVSAAEVVYRTLVEVRDKVIRSLL